MWDPFKLMWRVYVAGFKIFGYLVASLAQTLWYAYHGQTGKIGDAIGAFGRGAVDAIGEIFQR